MAVSYLFNLSHTQQELQTVNDSLKAIREESSTIVNAQKAKSDSIQLQMSQINQKPPVEQLTEHQKELLIEYQKAQEARRQHESRINEGKRQIDNRIKELGVEQMLDTLSCQLNVPIPIITILHQMWEEIEEPELKDYFENRYHGPLLKRFFSLPPY